MGRNPPYWVKGFNDYGFDVISPTFRGQGRSEISYDCPNHENPLTSPRCLRYIQNLSKIYKPEIWSITSGSRYERRIELKRQHIY